MKKLLASLLAVGAMLTVGAYAADADLSSDDMKINLSLVDLSADLEVTGLYGLNASIYSGSPVLTFLEDITFKKDTFVLYGYDDDAEDYIPFEYGVSDPAGVVELYNFGTAKKPKYYSQPCPNTVTDNGDGTVTVHVEYFAIPDDATAYYSDELVLGDILVAFASGKTVTDIKANDVVINCFVSKNGTAQYSNNKYAASDTDLVLGVDFFNDICEQGEIEEPEIKMTDKVGIRSDSAATTGIRFVGNTATANKDIVKEYGFIAAIESDKSGLAGTDYTVDMALVEAGKAKKGVAFKKDETDIYYDIDGEDTVLTCIVNGMPINPKAVKTNIAVRAYMILDSDKVVYSVDTTKDTAYNVAYSVKAAGGDEYTENQEYIDEILAQDESHEVPIDLSPLFE